MLVSAMQNGCVWVLSQPEAPTQEGSRSGGIKAHESQLGMFKTRKYG